MAKTGVFPRDEPRVTTSRAEHLIHAALRLKLPAGWLALHQLTARVAKTKEIAEIDFLVAVPERGILILEAKSGLLQIEDGHWSQNHKRLAKAPLDQAYDARRKLAARLLRAWTRTSSRTRSFGSRGSSGPS